MTSLEIAAIEAEITRLEELCELGRTQKNFIRYSHFSARIQDLQIVVVALKQLDDRISALE